MEDLDSFELLTLEEDDARQKLDLLLSYGHNFDIYKDAMPHFHRMFFKVSILREHELKFDCSNPSTVSKPLLVIASKAKLMPGNNSSPIKH